MSIAKIIAVEGIKSLVIDMEKDFIKLGLASKIANAMGAEYFKPVDPLSSRTLVPM